MTSRIGTCSGCLARFKVPESFSGDRAKCRKCGGIIEIDPFDATLASPATIQETGTESAPEQVRSEATAFSFASIGARAAAPAMEAPSEASVEPASEPALAEPPAPTEPVEPIAQPPPQRPSAPAKRAVKAPKPPKRSSPESSEPKKLHDTLHEKRHLKTGVWIAVALVVLGAGYLLFAVMGHEEPAESGTISTSKTPPKPKGGAGASLASTFGESSDPAADPGVAAGGEQDPEEAAADGEPGVAEEPIPAKFEFVALERSPGTTDEEWGRMQELSATLRDGGKARKLALKELLHYGIKAVPVLVNSLNGLDLAKYSQWVDGAEVSRFIQDDLLAETILIPYHGAFSTDPKEVRHNQVVLKSMVDYWNAQVNDPARWGALLTKYEEKRATRGARGR